MWEMNWLDFRVQRRLNIDLDKIEEVYALISEIDGVKNSWTITERLLPQTIERLTRSVIVTSAGSSNRIEGNQLSDLEVEGLYKKLRVKQFKTRDEQEVVGYLECMELVFGHYQELSVTESFILQLHNDMLAHSHKDAHHKGSYKFGSNRVEAKDQSGNVVGVIFNPTPPYLVQKEMYELLGWYQWAVENRVKHPLILIANFIFEYLAIHPFQDGNGRTSRLITNLMLLRQGYLFDLVVSHERVIEKHKVDYYLALNKTQSTWKKEHEDITPWLMFFLNVIKLQSDQALKIMLGENIEYLLSEKQLVVWQWVSELSAEFTRKDVIGATGFPARTIESIIKKLVDLKQIESLGKGAATRYRVIQK